MNNWIRSRRIVLDKYPRLMLVALGAIFMSSCSDVDRPSVSGDASAQSIISTKEWVKINEEFDQAWDREAELFGRLFRESRFEEIEQNVERMRIELVDVFQRQRIFGALVSMREGLSFSEAIVQVSKWCKQYPNSYIAFAVKGHFYTRLAWCHRGGGYAHTVTDEGWKRFYKNLKFAREALHRSYELNPQSSFAATRMITVAMGLGYTRPEMEKWFQRSISVQNIETRSYLSKVRFLQPKWRGSVEEVVSFAYETDRPGIPSFTRATTYANVWLNMPSRKQDLLTNKTFVSKTAAAYERSLKEYPYRIVQRKFCAYFAARSGNHSLAAKQFQYFTWSEDDEHLHLWESKAELEGDRANSIKRAREEAAIAQKDVSTQPFRFTKLNDSGR